MKFSKSSAASIDIDIARLLGDWNWFQSLSSQNLEILNWSSFIDWFIETLLWLERFKQISFVNKDNLVPNSSSKSKKLLN